ncbi:MAG: acyl-CoA dehydrogenase family protein [Microbacterium sp.]|uniref:acyl-CoA dehydrogenase family protein n=1 Tax=Microbacterium sp. TaxID=51671 RepID=UPI0039E62A49
MNTRTPTQASTTDLIARIDAQADLLGDTADESEALRRLSPRAVDVLVDIGTPRLRLPADFGGWGLSLVDEMTVLKRIAELDASSAWCTMVTSTATSMLAATLHDEAFEEIFGGDRIPVAVGVALPGGSARPVDGGYIVDGRWSFCSGIHMADWIMCNPLIDGDPAQPLPITVARENVSVHDSWNVIGLRGSGSADFSLDSVFIADRYIRSELPVRTGSAEGHPPAPPDEHIAIALGLATRALRELRLGYETGRYKWRDREVVQSEYSRLSIAVEAADRMAFGLFAEIDARAPLAMSPGDALKLKALGTHVTELAVECADFAMRRGGGRALYMPNPLERTLRDALSARAHVLVSDQNFSAHGAFALGLGAPGEW